MTTYFIDTTITSKEYAALDRALTLLRRELTPKDDPQVVQSHRIKLLREARV